MSRYSSYSSYRSPYSETNSSSSYSTHSYPEYGSKYESLVARSSDGSSRTGSGAGAYSKYDYLSSYSSSSKADTGSDRTPYYKSSTYASVIDTDELTKNYFAKYYNKSSSSGTSNYSVLEREVNASTSRNARAYSVYVDDDRDKPSRFSVVPESRSYRSSSIAAEPASNRSSTSTDTIRRRFNKTLSIYDETDNGTSYTNGNGYSNGDSYTSSIDNDTSKQEEEAPKYKYSSGYVRFADRKKQREEAEETTPSSTSQRRTWDSWDKAESPLNSTSSQRAVGGRSNYGSDNEGYNSRYGNSYSSSYSNGYHKEESPKEETDGASNQGINGLRNIGNTCFMNSVIQCLSNTKPLMNYLAQDDYSREINTSSSSMKGSLVKAFATVIKGLWKVNGRVVDPSSLKGAIQRFAPRFSGYNQEDSQEFLRYLLEGLHEDVNRVTTRPAPINTEIDTSLSVSEQAMEAWKRYIRRDDSHLVDLFVGQLKSTLQCTHCNHESVTFEPFWDLSLGIPSRSGDVSLLECFDAFTKEETLDGDEMPTCEACKMRRKSTKRYTLYRLPKILVVHLKRFSPTERFRQKLSSVVSFPLSGFSLSRYTDSVTCSSYNCYAISNHSGTLSSGHYTAYAKHPNSGQWHLYNDTRVSKCSSSSVITNEAYLLFFELA